MTHTTLKFPASHIAILREIEKFIRVHLAAEKAVEAGSELPLDLGYRFDQGDNAELISAHVHVRTCSNPNWLEGHFDQVQVSHYRGKHGPKGGWISRGRFTGTFQFEKMKMTGGHDTDLIEPDEMGTRYRDAGIQHWSEQSDAEEIITLGQKALSGGVRYRLHSFTMIDHDLDG